MSGMLQKYFPFFPAFEEEEGGFPWRTLLTTDLSVYEDDKAVYVEAALPGLKPEEIDVTFQKGILTLRGNQKEEEVDQKKRYYRKANRTYSYRIAVPGNIDEAKEPTAEYKNGVMTITFNKQQKSEPKRIQIKT
jgi:HSP20 family protein